MMPESAKDLFTGPDPSALLILLLKGAIQWESYNQRLRVAGIGESTRDPIPLDSRFEVIRDKPRGNHILKYL